MDILSLKSFVDWAGGFVALVLLANLIYVLYKTRSFHILRLRIWQRTFGKEPVSDPIVKEFIEHQSSLVAFRLFSGLPMDDLEELHQLKRWSARRGISLLQLSSIARFFDVKKRCITLLFPNDYRIYRTSNSVVLAICICFLWLLFFVSLDQRVNIRVAQTSHWYWVDTQTAFTPLWDWPGVPATSSELFYKKQCPEITEPLPGFDVKDQKVLCDFWQKEDVGTEQQAMLTTQRLLAVYFLLLFGFITAWRIVRETQLQTLEQLYPKIDKDDSVL